MALDLVNAVRFVQTELTAQADLEKAVGMQAYMKTDMPFYGVQKAGRVPILREIKKQHAPQTHAEYMALVSALWELPHREEKYIAQGVATTFAQFMVPASMPIYRRFVVDGAWWDFVDETATHMIRPLVLEYPGETWPEVDGWNHSEDVWLRRASIICQIGAKEQTDTGRLFRFCAERLHEKEFFIRKAIGWALREYAKTDPEWVASFLREHHGEMSGLSFREASKHIGPLVDR